MINQCFLRWVLMIGGVVLAPSALADVDYYTYGGFTSIVNAFTRIAVIFDDGDYLFFAYVASLIGVTVGMMVKSGLAAFGKAKAGDVLGVLFLTMLGTGVFLSLFTPKTTVHIYDTTSNQYQSVGSVPNALAFIASGSNLLERFATEVVSDSSVFGRDRHANGKSLELLLNLINSDPLPNNLGATKSIESFIKGCVTPAVVNSVSYDDFDYNAVLSGTSNLWEELAKTKNGDQYFLWFDDTDQRGVSTDCSTGFDDLKELLEAEDTFTNHIANVCEISGFDSTIEDEMNDCRDLIEDAVPLVFAASVTTTPENLSAMAALSDSLYFTLAEKPGSAVSAIGNSKQLAQGFGSVIVSEGWLPVMRSSTLVLILSFTPIIVLLMVTPFLFRALHMLSALFVFLMIWGVSDAVVHSVIVDNIQALFMETQNYDGGLRAFMMAPTEIQKAISMFGKLQSLGVLFAALVTAYYFRFSGHQFASMSEKVTADIDNIGQQTGMETIDATSRMETMLKHKEAAGHYNAQEYIGSELYGAGIESHATHHTLGNAQEHNMARADGIGKIAYMGASSEHSAGNNYGQLRERLDQVELTDGNLGEISRNYAQTNQQMSDANTRVHQDQLERYSGNPIDQSDQYADTLNASTIGQVTASRDPQEHIQAATTRTRENLGATDAIEERADANFQTVERYAKDQAITTQEGIEATGRSRDLMVSEGAAADSRAVAQLGAENSDRQAIAHNQSREEVSANLGKTEQEVTDNAALQNLESQASQHKTRQALADKTELSRQEISDRQAQAGVKAVLTPEQIQQLNNGEEESDIKIPTSSAEFTGSFEIDETGEITDIVNPSISDLSSSNQGSISRISGGTEFVGLMAEEVRNLTGEEVVHLLNMVDTESSMLEMAKNISNSSPIQRSLSESESGSWSTNAELSGFAAIGKKLDIESITDGLDSVLSGQSKGGDVKSVDDMLGVNKKKEIDGRNSKGGLADVVKGGMKNLAPNAEIGARGGASLSGGTTDTTTQVAGINPTQNEVYQLIKEHRDALEEGHESTDVIANSFKDGINRILDRDYEMFSKAGNESDLELLDDSISLNTKIGEIGDGLITKAEEAYTEINDWFDDVFEKVRR